MAKKSVAQGGGGQGDQGKCGKGRTFNSKGSKANRPAKKKK